MADFAMHVAAEECYQAASLPGQPIGQVLPSEQPRLSMARQVPAGVVAVISPFNVPIILGIRSVAPALALGNAVILKPDPRTPVSGGGIMHLVDAVGVPPLHKNVTGSLVYSCNCPIGPGIMVRLEILFAPSL